MHKKFTFPGLSNLDYLPYPKAVTATAMATTAADVLSNPGLESLSISSPSPVVNSAVVNPNEENMDSVSQTSDLEDTRSQVSDTGTSATDALVERMTGIADTIEAYTDRVAAIEEVAAKHKLALSSLAKQQMLLSSRVLRNEREDVRG